MNSKQSHSRLMLIMIWLYLSGSLNLTAQTLWHDRSRNAQNTIPYRNLFLYKTHVEPTASADTVQFTFYAKIVYDFLQFVLKDTLYEAQYELTIAIKNDDEETLAGTIRRKKITVNSYQETNDRQQFTLETHRFSVPTGEYTLYVELLDTETSRPIRQKEDIRLPDFFAEPFTTTHVLYFSNTQDPVQSQEALPNISSVFSMEDIPFLATFAICTRKPFRDFEIKQTIINSDKQSVYENTYSVKTDTQVYPIEITMDQKLNFGQYRLRMEISDGSTVSTLESPFYIRWKSHSTEIPNLVQAVETVRLIMDRNEWNQLKDKPTEEQEILLEAFWEERDPTPGTKENELEDEYYRRVTFANRNFAPWNGQLDGWFTDRGKTYIVYGPPSDVDNPSTPTGESSRYEIWYYRNLQKRFVFLDKFGTGEYRLITEE